MGERQVGFPGEVELQGPEKGYDSEHKVKGYLCERVATRHKAVKRGTM